MAERNSKRSREPASDSPQNSFSPRSTSLKRGGSSKLSVEFLLNQEPDPVSSCSGGNRPARPVSRPIPISKSSSGGSGELEETSSEVSSDHSVQGKEESSHPQHQRHESQSSSTHSPLNAPRVQGSPAQLGPVEKRRTLSPMRLHGQSDVHPRPSADRSTAATAPRNQQSTLDDLRPTSPALAQRAQSSPRGSFHASSSRISEQQPVPVHSAQRGSPSRGDSGNESERTFSCSRCNKTFKERGNLNKHFSSVHDGLRPHACSQPGCSKTFSFRDGLLRHEATVHRMERPHICPHCNKTFKQLSHLNKHLRSAIHRQQ